MGIMGQTPRQFHRPRLHLRELPHRFREFGHLTIFPRLFDPLPISHETTFVPDLGQRALVMQRARPRPCTFGFARNLLHVDGPHRPQGRRAIHGQRQRLFPRYFIENHLAGGHRQDRGNSLRHYIFTGLFEGRLIRGQGIVVLNLRHMAAPWSHMLGKNAGGNGPLFFLNLRPPGIRLKLNHASLGRDFGHGIDLRHVNLRLPSFDFHCADLIEYQIPAPRQIRIWNRLLGQGTRVQKGRTVHGRHDHGLGH